MSRLPTVGSDNNDWGNVLNDYLQVSLNTDGTIKKPSIESSLTGDITSHTHSNSVMVSTTFTGSILLDKQNGRDYGIVDITTNNPITLDLTGLKNGACAQIGLRGDGVHTPVLTDFKSIGSSYDNTLNMLNVCKIFEWLNKPYLRIFDKYQDIATAPTLVSVATSTDGLTVIATFNIAMHSSPTTVGVSFSPTKTISSVVLGGTTTQIIITVNSAFSSTDTITATLPAWLSESGGAYAGVSNTAVTNNVTSSSYRSDTLAYQARVVADGGSVTDMAYVDSIFALIATQGIYSQGKVWISPSAGVKLSGANVIKMYNLFGTDDAVGASGYYPTFQTTSNIWGRKSAINTQLKSLIIPSLTLPMWVDTFSSQNIVDLTKETGYFYHGNIDPSATSRPGLSRYNNQQLEAARGTGFHVMNISGQYWRPRIDAKRIVTHRYGSTGHEAYWGNSLITLTFDSGSQVANSDLTADLTIADRLYNAPNTMVDTVIFTPLASTPYATVRNFLNNTYEGVRIVYHGASLAGGTGTTDEKGSSGFAQAFYEASGTPTKSITGYTVYSSGATIANMASEVSTLVDPLHRTGDILVVIDGPDDTAENGATAQETYDEYLAYCQARVAVGWKVIACTMIDANPVLYPTYAAKIATINANMRANFPGYGITVCDIASDSRLMDSTNETYFIPDHQHPNDAGATIIGQFLYNSIISII